MVFEIKELSGKGGIYIFNLKLKISYCCEWKKNF